MAELANCTRCNSVFVKGLQAICQNCYIKEEEAFQTVYRFLKDRKNREANMLEIVEATGIEEVLITKFIKEKRLLPTDFPKLAYPCVTCGTEIISGKLCLTCTEELRKDLLAYEETEKRLEEVRTNAASRTNTYYSMDTNKNTR